MCSLKIYPHIRGKFKSKHLSQTEAVMMEKFREELKKLWAFLTTFMFIVNYLLFLTGLNYIPTIEGAVNYTTKILTYMVQNAMISTVEGALISLVITLSKDS
jgi:hypothetical protein